MSDMLYPHEKEVLKTARETYGNKNQILVCMEELNELACVLAKYPRYEDESKATYELHNKILDEYVDVLIILDHVKNIADLSDTEIRNRLVAKIDRLQRWLTHSDSMQETVDDRKVVETPEPCKSCLRKHVDEFKCEDYCSMCLRAQGTEGTSPFYIKDYNYTGAPK